MDRWADGGVLVPRSMTHSTCFSDFRLIIYKDGKSSVSHLCWKGVPAGASQDCPSYRLLSCGRGYL
jgi:hypothetical protein